ncbi:DgyrCDS12817 [Dimorphilus gyrociliatus]|uniref:DgyrCDS12817 n=1 Tax=Dimorphilus gyrociliatus TaxID=2664684 RepID=A0A7I8W8T7_9ANNE|nr:DgyrCDS12817 [Dimorphilus gyrociliatus]
MSTVGYGDVTPTTVGSKIFTMVFIFIALYLFAINLEVFYQIVNESSIFRKSYQKPIGVKHVIIAGSLSFDSITKYIKDFMHEDRDHDNYTFIFVNKKKPNLSIRSHFEKNYSHVRYHRGDPMEKKCWKSVKLKEADALLVVTDYHTKNPDEEDRKNILQVISAKNYSESTRVILQLLRFHNKHYIVHLNFWKEYDQVICEDSIKLGFLAQNCLTPGFSTLISNLSNVQCEKEILTTSLTKDTEQHRQNWRSDYVKGADMEIYAKKFPSALHNYPITEAVKFYYKERNILLLGIKTIENNEEEIKLNPSSNYIIDKSTTGFFICKSEKVLRECNKSFKKRELHQSSISLETIQLSESSLSNQCNSESYADENNQIRRKLDATNNFHWSESVDFDTISLTDENMMRFSILKNHIVVCLFCDENSPLIGLYNFVLPLRSSSIDYKQLSSIGSPLNRKDLRATNVDSSRMCVVLKSPKCTVCEREDEEKSLDDDVIICTQLIKSMEFHNPEGIEKCKNLTNKQKFQNIAKKIMKEYLIERLRSNSFADIVLKRELIIHKRKSSNRRTIKEDKEIWKNVEESGQNIEIVSDLDCDSKVRLLNLNGDGEDDIPFRLSQPFASGKVITSNLLESLLCSVYFNPDLLKLIKLLISGTVTNECEELIDEGFGIAKGLEQDGETENETKGKCTLVQLDLEKGDLNAKNLKYYSELFNYLYDNYNILPIGVYRQIENSQCYKSKSILSNEIISRYVITNPSGEFVLNRNDYGIMGNIKDEKIPLKNSFYSHESKTKEEKDKNSRREEDLSCFSKTFLCWANDIFRAGYKGNLEKYDKFYSCDREECEDIRNRINVETLRISTFRAVCHVLYSQKLLLLGTISALFISEMLKFVIIIQMKLLFNSFEIHNTLSTTKIYVTAVSLPFVIYLLLKLNGISFYYQTRLQARVRSGFCLLIYEKILKIPTHILQDLSVGKIVNLLSTDVETFVNNDVILYIFIGPFQIFFAQLLLLKIFGHIALLYLPLMIFFMTLNSFPAFIEGNLRKQVAERTDKRVTLMNELINGIKIVKIYALSHTSTGIILLIIFTIFGESNQSQPLHLSSSYAAIALLTDTGQSLFNFSTEGIAQLKTMQKSVVRILDFINNPEVVNELVKYKKNYDVNTLSIDKITSYWNKSMDLKCVENISISLERGEKLFVVGAVGSGKTGLLLSIIGELHGTGTNEFRKKFSFSYFSQESWIFNGTIKENILFHSTFEECKYNRILEVCALKKDLEIFPAGDTTLVGEKGLMLSGGQKARIALARCLYKDSDVYLLDDPLSAVDNKVRDHIFYKCISEYLKDKIVILVTHHPDYMKDREKLVIMEKGKAGFYGTYESYKKEGCYSNLVKSRNDDNNNNNNNNVIYANEIDLGLPKYEAVDKKSSGRISWSVYKSYILSGKVWALFLSLGIACVHITLTLYSNYVLASIYKPIITSYNIHNKLFSKVIRAKMEFFDKTPSGNILNRFSRDLCFIDFVITNSIRRILTVSLYLLSGIVTCLLALPWLIIPTIIVLLSIIFLFNYSIPTIRDMRRLEAAKRSPFYSHVSETISGLKVIRSLQKSKKFRRICVQHLNNHSKTWLTLLTVMRWFGYKVNKMVAIFMLSIVVPCVAERKHININLFAVGVIQIIGLAELFEYLFRVFVELENAMTSLERINEYSNLSTEDPFSNTAKLPDEWPETGNLEVKDLSLKYTGNNYHSLKSIEISFKDGEKTGIIGRTGAGKSSILAALFRLQEPEGSILLDHIDLTKIALNQARKVLGVIPQDPVIFIGNIRNNLDPFNIFSDDLIWEVLRKTQLYDKFNNCSEKLDFPIAENGNNLSVGEKQLICLGRALLRNPKVLVMDEATASIDKQTDDLIQRIIMDNFKECTKIVIAHRLDTVSDSDKIVVLDTGEIVEIGKPQDVFSKINGTFMKNINDYLK